MATYPPPVPPPYSSDPRQQRQYLKAMARAQKDAAREYIRQEAFRRNLLRRQERAYRRSSILGPLLVLAAGVIFLLIGLGKLPLAMFLDWYGRWWPLFLVAAGVILVGEWAFDQSIHGEDQPYVRRGIGGGAVFLLILLAIAGPIIRAVHAGRDALTGANTFFLNGDNLDELFGEKHDSEQQIDQPFAPGTSLTIDNPHGDVTIVGKSSDNQIHITVAKQIYGRSDSEAADKAQRFSPQVSQFGSVLNVSVPTVQGASADLSITLPDSGETTVTANHGAVNISSMRAPVNVTTNHGNIDLNSIAGPVNVHINSSGSSFAGHNITGAVYLKGRGQDLSVTDVTGDVTLEGEFFGDTHLERLRSPVSFHTSRTQLSLMQLDGNIDVSSRSELNGSQIVGPLRLKTSSRNISFERVAGDVDITDSNGSVDVSSAAPLGNVSVENRNGSIHLTVPSRAGFNIDAEAREGSVDNDLALSSNTAHNRTTLAGRVGDGSTQITLRTTHADIDIHKSDVAPPVPPAKPESPAKPAAPAKPAIKSLVKPDFLF